MARVVVLNEKQDRILLDEQVQPIHFEDEHASLQILERLAWAILRADYARPEEITQSALAAFEVASWDIIGQALGVPIWKLVGGRARDRMPAYANGWYQANRDPKTVGRLAVSVLAAVRDAVGPIRLFEEGWEQRGFGGGQ